MCYNDFVERKQGQITMNINNVNVHEIIAQARTMLQDSKSIPAELSVIFSLILTLFERLLTRLNKNSKNSSIPPSQDPNRAKSKNNDDCTTKRKPGGQPGRLAKVLQQISKPDEVISIPVDRAILPKDHSYKVVDYVKRQVVEFIIKSHVKEYRLEVLEDETGKRYIAEAPEGASRPIQYGASIKATSVYMNLYQMIPYARLQDFFLHQGDIPISEGSVFNFNKEASDRLDAFAVVAKSRLEQANVLHTDETGINVNGKRLWLHNASNDKWVWLQPHATRGLKAMDEIGILPNFRGVMVHDGWSPYFTYKDASHSLCNAHHLRELQAAIETYQSHTWARKMKALLLTINEATIAAGGVLKESEAQKYRRDYREIIAMGEIECPELLAPPLNPTSLGQKKKRGNGRVAQTKERNLLQRLKLHENETLRFMTDIEVPFTNNRGENDIRMTKVQQKISGCFKTIDNAKIFCRIRSYLLTAQKHGVHATDALTTLFSGKLPDFCAVV